MKGIYKYNFGLLSPIPGEKARGDAIISSLAFSISFSYPNPQKAKLILRNKRVLGQRLGQAKNAKIPHHYLRPNTQKSS